MNYFYRNGRGMYIADDKANEYSLLANSWSQMFKNNNLMTADDGTEGDPYFYREMSGSMTIEIDGNGVYQKDKHQGIHDISVRYEKQSSLSFDPGDSYHTKLLTFRINQKCDSIEYEPEK